MAQRIHYTTVEQLQTSARKDCFIHDDDEFQIMLNFYHDLGLIIKHRSTVVLEAKWLIDLFKELITIPRFDEAVRKKKQRKEEFHNFTIFQLLRWLYNFHDLLSKTLDSAALNCNCNLD